MKLVAAVLLENRHGELLFGRKVENNLYCCPGGKHEGEEKLVWTAIRELYEETGITVKDINDVHFLGYIEPDDKLIMFYWCWRWGGDPINTEPHKCHGWEWHPWDKWPEPCIRSLEMFPHKLLGALKRIRHHCERD